MMLPIQHHLETLPHVSERRIAIHITAAAQRVLQGGHPWLFADSIVKQSHSGQPGDLAVIFDNRRRFLAIGLYDPESPMRVRILQHRQQATIDRKWFQACLQTAVNRRKPLDTPQTTGYRLVHGENDSLPGLIVDRYGDTLVLKLYTAAWLPHLADIISGLQQVQPHDRLILRLSRNAADAFTPYDLYDGQILMGSAIDGPNHFIENGLRFAADVLHGHKTGFFFDQRDNRAHVRDLSTGRHVLDVFAYTGGFSVYAAAGGAQSVTSLDVSAPALQSASTNFALNQDLPAVATCQHHSIIDDAFSGLEDLHATGQQFDMVIVDPPAFAKNAAEVDRALAAYQRLVRSALNVLEPEGILVMASCSSRVSSDDFFNTIHQMAAQVGRPLKEIERTGHTLDHPIGFPEGEYLKCLFAHSP